MNRRSAGALPREPRFGLARVISKRGICSRALAARMIVDGRVRCDGRTVRDPEFPATLQSAIEIDGNAAVAAAPAYLMLNKPRGLVTTTRDEQSRATVYTCFADAALPWLAPVGRLDKASEGLLLFTNDPAFADRLTAPATKLDKTYHVQVDRIPDAGDLIALRDGVLDQGEHLTTRAVRLLRHGDRTAWLEVVLDEGRNRQVRRLLASRNIGVLRLVRVAIGDLVLGELAKGAWRHLTQTEVDSLLA